MTAPHTQCQPEANGLRRDPPVCCYCDNDLSCGHCGMEQPYDDVSLLKARVEELTKALEWRPIETAPKDGTNFLGVYGLDVDATYWVLFWNGKHFECCSSGFEVEHATQWMPLPGYSVPLEDRS